MRETVCTVVHQRTASLDSERGIDDGSEVHEGRRQTVRREVNSQSTGRPRLKLPAFQPDWRKSAVRNDRGDDGNGGIIRSPLRAIVLPDRASGVEEPTPRMAVHHRAHGSDSERDTTWSYGVHEGRMQTYVLRGVCLVLA